MSDYITVGRCYDRRATRAQRTQLWDPQLDLSAEASEMMFPRRGEGVDRSSGAKMEKKGTLEFTAFEWN